MHSISHPHILLVPPSEDHRAQIPSRNRLQVQVAGTGHRCFLHFDIIDVEFYMLIWLMYTDCGSVGCESHLQTVRTAAAVTVIN